MAHLYFIAGLIASAAMVLALLTVLVISLRINWNHANRQRLSYLAPILLTLAIVYICVTELVPRAFDLVHLAGRRYDVIAIDLKDVSLGRGSLKIDGQSYYFMPGTFDKQSRGRFQIMFTPGTHFIVHATYLEESPGD